MKNSKILTNFLETIFKPEDFLTISQIPEKGSGLKGGIEKNYNFEKALNILISDEIYRDQKRFVCFTPNPIILGARRSEQNVSALNCFFVDIDNNDLPEIASKAHFVFSRGPKNHHLYFLIDRLEPTEKNLILYKTFAKQLVSKCGGDKAVHDPARILRVPYSPHRKNGKDNGCYELVQKNEISRYSLKQIRELYENKKNIEKITEPRKIDYIDFIRTQFTKRNIIYAGDGRSQQLLFIGFDSHAWGVDKKEALELAFELNDKIFSDPESSDVVEHQIESAYKYRKAAFGNLRGECENANDREKQKLLSQQEELNRVRDILKDYIYILDAERFINKTNGSETTSESQTANKISYITQSNLSLKTLLRNQAIEVCDKLDFRPDIDTRIFSENGLKIYNRYQKNEISNEFDKKDVQKYGKIFTEHLKYLTNNEKEFEALLNYFAFLVQYPGQKLMYALLVVSKFQGVGKSRIQELFKNIFKNYVGEAENSELSGNYTDFIKDKLLIFVHELWQGDKHAALNKLKNLITEGEIRILEKYARTYTVKNTTNFIFFSNHFDAAWVDKYNRRLLIITTEKKPNGSEYYDILSDAFENHFEEIFNFLLTIDLSNFNPNIAPIETAGRDLMVEQSRSEIEIYLNELIDSNVAPFDRKFFTARDLAQVIEQGPQTIKFKAGIKSIQKFLINHDFKNFVFRKMENGSRVSKSYWSRLDFKECEKELNRKDSKKNVIQF